jgi:ubiquinone/menaquinone biosynthesis C-methylase UbiE
MTPPTNPSDASQHQSNFVIEESGTEIAWLLNSDVIVTAGMGGLFSERGNDLSGIHDILDIACGPGGWDLEVARAYPDIQVTGVDISEPMINYARAHAQARGLDNAHFRVMNALEPLDFRDASFDLVNARTIVGFMTPDAWPILLQECKRVLRPGGTIRLSEFDKAITTSPITGQVWDLLARAMSVAGRTFSPDGRSMGITTHLARLLRQAGFQDIQSRAHDIDHAAGTPAFEGWYQNYRIVFQLLSPFIIGVGVTTAEEFERLYQQMLLEMLAEDFCALETYLTVWGVKP